MSDNRDDDKDDKDDEDGLRVLTRRPATTSGWLPPDVVRRVAVRRRRRGLGRGLGLGAAVVVAALVAVLVPALHPGGSPGPAASRRPVAAPRGPVTAPRGPVAAARGLRVAARLDGARELVAPVAAAKAASSPDVAKVADADTAFGIRLLQQLFPTDGSNVSVSPASLSLALAMLQNGAAGQTQSQILSAMQAGDLSPSELDAGWAALAEEWSQAAKDGGLTFTSANSVWVQSGLTPGARFMAALGRYFGSGEWQADFAHDSGGAVRAINAWVAQHTSRRITKLFDQLDPSTLLVLVNAVYFQATWQDQFDPDDTAPARFTEADGTTERVPFMHLAATVPVARQDGYEAVQLPYRGGRFAALAVMPTSGSLRDFVRGLTPDQLAAIAGAVHPAPAAVSLPRFTTRSSFDDLPATLRALGMTDAFGAADFSPMRVGPASVDQVVQKVFLKVGEKGTQAAAATGVAAVSSAVSLPSEAITLDHPFLFLVRDVKTGAVLFASAIQHPKG